MAEQELENLLGNMSLEQLKDLKSACNKYEKEKGSIELLEKWIVECDKEKAKSPQMTPKGKSLKANLSFISRLPQRRSYQIEGTLLPNQTIDTLSIDGRKLDTKSLDSRAYSKLLFKKPKGNLNKAAISLIISVIINALGIVTQMHLLNIVGSIMLFPACINFVKYMDDKLEPTLHSKISQRKLNKFQKRLKESYAAEKVNADEAYIQNQLFAELKKDICVKNVESKERILQDTAKEIQTILMSGNYPFTDEELVGVQNKVIEARAKILKKSLS